MTPIRRNPQSVLLSSELRTLYDEVLLYYENDDTDFRCYNLNTNPFLSNLQEKKGFKLQSNMENVDDTINTFYFTNSKNQKIKSWFFHLRNAFAHNRIFRNEGENIMKIEDVDRGRLTMIATISSFEKLVEIITSIKQQQ